MNLLLIYFRVFSASFNMYYMLKIFQKISNWRMAAPSLMKYFKMEGDQAVCQAPVHGVGEEESTCGSQFCMGAGNKELGTVKWGDIK